VNFGSWHFGDRMTASIVGRLSRAARSLQLTKTALTEITAISCHWGQLLAAGTAQASNARVFVSAVEFGMDFRGIGHKLPGMLHVCVRE